MIESRLAWLDEHVDLEQLAAGRVPPPDLERMRELAAWLGDPQDAFPVVHITGTNGKTSTARMTAALLEATGLSVGLYTSPHLERVHERIAWNGSSITDAQLAEVLHAVELAEQQVGRRMTYFELLTAAAFRFFADLAVDVAVVEVGLGGTWDATNIVHGAVAVVTNVSIDHVAYLGSTTASIAAEKAGIIEAGASLVLGETDPELSAIFESRGPGTILRRNVDFGVTTSEVALGGRSIELFTPGGHHECFLPLHGAHQADNAALALAAAEQFAGGRGFAEALVSEGFERVRVPGRMEAMARRPLVLLDGAHNVAGIEVLNEALEEAFATGPRTLVVGLLAEKDPAEMLDALDVTSAEHLVVCRPPSPRARDPHDLLAAAVQLGLPRDRIDVAETPAAALERARALTPPEGQVVVTGSLYLVGSIRAAMAGATPPEPS